MHQHRMAARDQECNERKRGLVILERRREQMPFHVVYGDCRYPPRIREAATEGRPDEQRTD